MLRERRRAVYRGRVQGVGFRATTRRLASGFTVSGFVRNLPDGRVEVVADGEPGELDRFLDAVGREFAGAIQGVEVAPLAGEEPLPDLFSIRY